MTAAPESPEPAAVQSAETDAAFRIVRYPLNPTRIGIEGPVTPYSPGAINPWRLVGWIAGPSGRRVPITASEIERVTPPGVTP